MRTTLILVGALALATVGGPAPATAEDAPAGPTAAQTLAHAVLVGSPDARVDAAHALHGMTPSALGEVLEAIHRSAPTYGRLRSATAEEFKAEDERLDTLLERLVELTGVPIDVQVPPERIATMRLELHLPAVSASTILDVLTSHSRMRWFVHDDRVIVLPVDGS